MRFVNWTPRLRLPSLLVESACLEFIQGRFLELWSLWGPTDLEDRSFSREKTLPTTWYKHLHYHSRGHPSPGFLRWLPRSVHWRQKSPTQPPVHTASFQTARVYLTVYCHHQLDRRKERQEM